MCLSDQGDFSMSDTTTKVDLRKISALVAVALLLICAITLIVGLLRWRMYIYTVSNGRYAEIVDKPLIRGLVREFVPPQADSISARITPASLRIVASFKISEKAFIEWADAKNWPIDDISQKLVCRISNNGDLNDSVMIDSGLLYQHEDETEQIVCAYDRNGGKGYITWIGPDY